MTEEESIFDNRIELFNPSSFFVGLTVENIRLGKRSSPIFKNINIIRCFGLDKGGHQEIVGIRKIIPTFAPKIRTK